MATKSEAALSPGKGGHTPERTFLCSGHMINYSPASWELVGVLGESREKTMPSV